jgi:DHA1 family bicyclomycin/chloramphenicol resistance-like MFS transporter
MNPVVIILALSFLLGLQPVATDLYLPALPQMQQALQITQADAQWTLSSIVLAFGVSQMVWGPVSDRIGRRPVLLAGLSLFVLASAGTVLAQSLPHMIALRSVQGVGLAASVVCARAMIRDLYEPEAGARVLSKGLSGLGVIALVGPILGGLTAQHLGWRATLAEVGLFAFAGLVFIALALHETLPLHRRQRGMSLAQRVSQWHEISTQPMFRAYTALTSSTYGGLYVFLAASSFVFIQVLGVSKTVYGGIMASMSLGYLLGTVLCRARLRTMGLPDTVRLGTVLSMAAAVWLIGLSGLCLALDWVPPAWLLMPGLWCYAIAHGVHQPCSQAGVVASFPQQAGAASALSGLIMSVLAFAIGAALATWSQLPGWAGTLHPMTLGVGLGALLTAHVGRTRVQRHGHPVVTTQIDSGVTEPEGTA